MKNLVVAAAVLASVFSSTVFAEGDNAEENKEKTEEAK
jgi:hypothetical protein